jgi:hypothetical protein
MITYGNKPLMRNLWFRIGVERLHVLRWRD